MKITYEELQALYEHLNDSDAALIADYISATDFDEPQTAIETMDALAAIAARGEITENAVLETFHREWLRLRDNLKAMYQLMTVIKQRRLSGEK